MSNKVSSKKYVALKSAALALILITISLVSCTPEPGPENPPDNTVLNADFGVENYSYTVTNIQIYEGESIRFVTSGSTTEILDYYWGFPGGTPDTSWEFMVAPGLSTIYSPLVTYLNSGTYSVSLGVSKNNLEGYVSKVRQAYITVLPDTTTGTGCGTTVTDIDGNAYDVVEIGSQCWMQENLKTATYNDGTPIPTGLTDGEWDIATTGAYSIYQDNSANDAIHGKLYNWYAVETGKLCPQGWHIPTKAEFETLINHIGGSSEGGALKSTNLWDVPNVGATNSSGFTALASGSRLETFWGYYGLGSDAHFWSTTEGLDGGAEHMLLSTYETDVVLESYPKLNGFSCRCVKD